MRFNLGYIDRPLIHFVIPSGKRVMKYLLGWALIPSGGIEAPSFDG